MSFALALVTSAFAQNVVGGSQVADGDWPDTAAIIYGNSVNCTGVLVAPDVVLTAGHCVGGITAVLLNTNDYTSGGERINVRKTIEYPNSWNTVDIAVLLLESEASTAPRVIAQDCVVDDSLADGADVAIVGYGATDIWGTQYGTKLREAVTPVTDHDCSNLSWGCNSSVSPGGEIAAGGDGVDACYGDSGGPLYLLTDKGDYLVGITSRALAGVYVPCEHGGIWGRPDSVLDWIESESGRSLPAPDCGGDDEDGGGDDGGGNDGGGGEGDDGGGDGGGGADLAPNPDVDPILTVEGADGRTIIVPNDPDDEVFSFAVLEAATHGEIAIDERGVVTYTPNSGFHGEDGAVLTVADDHTTVPVRLDVEVMKGSGCSTAPSGLRWGWLLGLAVLVRRRR